MFECNSQQGLTRNNVRLSRLGGQYRLKNRICRHGVMEESGGQDRYDTEMASGGPRPTYRTRPDGSCRIGQLRDLAVSAVAPVSWCSGRLTAGGDRGKKERGADMQVKTAPLAAG
jgi:hypothetical protein